MDSTKINLAHIPSSLSKLVKRWYIPVTIFITSRIFVFGIVWILSLYGLSQGSTLVRWDSHSYISIAQEGYQFNGEYTGPGSYIAFFPFFPILLAGTVSVLGVSFAEAALLISFVFGLASAILLYHLISMWKNEVVAAYGVLLFSFYPFSFFLSAPYTESLFMFLLLLSVWCIQKNKYAQGAVVVSVALITKMVGGVLGLVYAMTMFFSELSYTKIIRNSLVAGLPFIGFLYFQYIKYGTVFAFMNAQSVNWNQHTVWPWEGLLLMVERSIGAHADGFQVQSGIMLVLVLITMILSVKKVPKLIWWLGLAFLLLVLSSDSILGFGRYMIICLPLYYYWADKLHTRGWLGSLIIGVLAIWLGLATALFSLNYPMF